LEFDIDYFHKPVSEGISIASLFVIEPLIDGKRYFNELIIRKKAFRKLNNIAEDNIDEINIDGINCIDFQGYLISSQLAKFLENYNCKRDSLNGRIINLFKLNNYCQPTKNQLIL